MKQWKQLRGAGCARVPHSWLRRYLALTLAKTVRAVESPAWRRRANALRLRVCYQN